jgi:DNA repair ATPase RecN
MILYLYREKIKGECFTMDLTKEIERLIAQGVTLEDIARSFQQALAEFEAAEKKKNYEREKLQKLGVIIEAIAVYVQEYHPEVKQFVEFNEVTPDELRSIDANIADVVKMLKELDSLDNTLAKFANSLI